LISTLGLAQIPNGAFEIWVLDSAGNLNPQYWETLNDTPNISAEKYTPACGGNYSMKLMPLNTGFPIPGIAILEYKFNDRPDKLTGILKSNIANADEALIYLMFYKDTQVIAYPSACTFRLDTSYTTCTPFTLPISYISSEIPDSLTLAIVVGDLLNPNPATYIVIDDLKFEKGGSSHVESFVPQADKWVQIHPIPASNLLKLHFKEWVGPFKVSVSDITGKLVKEQQGNINEAIGLNHNCDISELPAGKYIVHIRSRFGDYSQMIQVTP
jgi:Secretion system C-terminal sorting domain